MTPAPVTVASVVIPAHDEERTIARLLEALACDPEIALELIVVCNGCSDRTAEIAKRFAPQVTVVEIAEASKWAALSRGDEIAHGFPRVYIDADVEITARSVQQLALAVGADAVLAAGPARVIPRAGTNVLVRWYYDVWERLPQVREGLFGRGVIAFSAAGHARIRGLPRLMSDDLAVSEAFGPNERAVVPTAQVVVRPPRTLSDLLRRRIRVATGNAQADAQGVRGHASVTRHVTMLRLVTRHPDLVAKVPVFLGVAVVARRAARRAVRSGDFTTWHRDESSREGPSR